MAYAVVSADHLVVFVVQNLDTGKGTLVGGLACMHHELVCVSVCVDIASVCA